VTTVPTLHANLLSYARSVQPGEGLFFGVTAGEPLLTDEEHLNRSALIPAEVEEVSVRGQISNYVSDPDNTEFNISEPNLQTIDQAKLPASADRLVVKTSLQFLPNSTAPHACDDKTVADNLQTLASKYRDVGGYTFLAKRYLWNVLNARWLWRNFLIMTDKKVHVLENGVRVLTADPAQLERDYYPGDDKLEEAAPGASALAERMGRALAGTGAVLSLELVSEGALPEGSEIFPSQEYLGGEAEDRVRRRRGNKNAGKVLSAILVQHGNRMVRQATFHPQKIGNAIRCVDEWHNSTETEGAMPADPYAALTTRAVALRPPKGGSFYDFLTRKNRREELYTALDKGDPADPDCGNVHFVFACLSRGGVFGGKE